MKVEGQQPQSRTGHSMIAVNCEQFLMVGGEKIKNDRMILQRDMWLFNFITKKWKQVHPQNGILRPLTDNHPILRDNFLYLVGGLAEKWDSWNDQVVSIEFGEPSPPSN